MSAQRGRGCQVKLRLKCRLVRAVVFNDRFSGLSQSFFTLILAARRSRLRFGRQLFKESVDCVTKFFAFDILEANDALRVEKVYRRPLFDLRLSLDGAGYAAVVPPATPRDSFFNKCLFQRFAIFVAVDTE